MSNDFKIIIEAADDGCGGWLLNVDVEAKEVMPFTGTVAHVLASALQLAHEKIAEEDAPVAACVCPNVPFNVCSSCPVHGRREVTPSDEAPCDPAPGQAPDAG